MDDEAGSSKDVRRSSFGDIMLGVLYGDLFAAAIAFGIYLLNALTEFGWGFFVALPCFAGFICGAFMRSRGHDVGKLAIASFLAVLLPCSLLFVWELEGAMCIIMSLPLIFLAHLLCGLLGGAAVGAHTGRPLKISFAVLAPLILASETFLPASPSPHTITTSIVVNATPERIWPYLSNLESIPPSHNVLFNAGVAHPISTRTHGQGVGAQRFCNLSTGQMPERITTWEPGRKLAFEVLETPPTMKEWNPLGPVHASHLTGYYNCRQGEFVLTKLDGDKTLVVGATTYDHRFGPSWYWSLWTDYIVRCVHVRVLEEIKHRAETPG